MANSGTAGNLRVLTFGVNNNYTYYTGGYLHWTSGDAYNFANLAYPATTNVGSARCGTYSGIFGGQLEDSAISANVPAYWDSVGTLYHLVHNGSSGRQPGLFWDVCDDGSGNDWFVGYYVDTSSEKQPAVWTLSLGADSPLLLPTGSYSGGEARGINANQDAGGQVFGSGGNPPAVWQYDGSDMWTLIDVSTSSDWPSGRDGYVIGLTDRDGAYGPYAVGYMCPTNDSSNDGQPFIYSVGTGHIRFCGTQYGPPTQVSNQSYDTGDVIVSFSGNNCNYAPYIWMGSPDPTSAYTGAADDIYAFLDPDVSFATAPTITGVNSTFHFGGSTGTGSTLAAWMSDDKGENWTFGSEPTYTFPVGYLKSMANADDMQSANGKFATVTGISTTGFEVDALWTVPSDPSPTEIAFRATGRLETNHTSVYTIDFYNWGTSTWVTQVTTTMPTYWQTQVAKIPASGSPYIYSGQMKARIKVTYPGASVLAWYADIEQAVFLWK